MERWSFFALIILINAGCITTPIPPSAEVNCSLCPEKIAACAYELSNPRVVYDASWQKIEYPMGDVDPGRGVCTDVVIRALRCVGIDLQVEVHEHRKQRGLSTDRHIDHRRVPNIAHFLEDHPDWAVIDGNTGFQPGDIIWTKIGPDKLDHMGVFVTPKRYMHNCGHGQNADGRPHRWPIFKVFRLTTSA